MRISLILAIGIVGLLLVACDAEAPEEDIDIEETQPEEEYFDASYEDDQLFFEGAVEKPTDCHELDVSYGFVQRRPNVLIASYRVEEPEGGLGEECVEETTYEYFEYEAELFGLQGVEVISGGIIEYNYMFEQ